MATRRRGPGRPPKPDPLTKITVVMTRSQIEKLDRAIADFKRERGRRRAKHLNRSAMLRTMALLVQYRRVDWRDLLQRRGWSTKLKTPADLLGNERGVQTHLVHCIWAQMEEQVHDALQQQKEDARLRS